MRVLNFGSMNIDTVFSVSHAVLAGESLAVSNPEIHAGGKGLNQSIAQRERAPKFFTQAVQEMTASSYYGSWKKTAWTSPV